MLLGDILLLNGYGSDPSRAGNEHTLLRYRLR
jgi:hypothetical protein